MILKWNLRRLEYGMIPYCSCTNFTNFTFRNVSYEEMSLNSFLRTISTKYFDVQYVYMCTLCRYIHDIYTASVQPINHCDISLRCRHRSLVASPAPPADNTQKQENSVQNYVLYSVIDTAIRFFYLQFIYFYLHV